MRNREGVRGGVWEVLTLLLACSCAGPGNGAPDLEKERFEPLPEYTTWWAEVEACSGREGDLGRVTFYRVLEPLSDGRSLFPCLPDDVHGSLCPGFW